MNIVIDESLEDQWYLGESLRSPYISNYFDFNRIDYTKVALIDHDEFGGYSTIPENLIDSSNNLLVITTRKFIDFFSEKKSQEKLFDFLKHNAMVVTQNLDSFTTLTNASKINTDIINDIINFDKIIRKNSTYILIDALPSTGHWLTSLQNVVVKQIDNVFINSARIENSVVEKNPQAKDFLITTIYKKDKRWHRKYLFKQMMLDQELLDNGICVFNKSKLYAKWTGEQPVEQYGWCDGYPSMSLYSNANVEIVPETLYKHGYFFTEKTMKPIMTQTPFLVVSTCGYLKYLKSLGFKTFDSLIDERYDLEFKVERRIDLMLETLRDIIKNGSREFYLAAADILEYNQNHLFYLSGKRSYSMDVKIKNVLDLIADKMRN